MRLIDADALMPNAKYKGAYDIVNAYDIAKAQTIDAVPVVRCKDCKYWNPTHRYCEGIGNWFGEVDSWSDYGFCYKGEKDGEVH